MERVVDVSLTEKNSRNGYKNDDKNAQSFIVLKLDNDEKVENKGWSGWDAWMGSDGNWYHLGGNKDNPVIYKLIMKDEEYKWTKKCSQKWAYSFKLGIEIDNI